MAEFVEFRAEEWMSELQQMERINLFDPKEIKAITTKRREFEYKLQRRTKSKEDFLKYIQFEVDLQRIIKARRETNKITQKMKQIEQSQNHRISKLFKQAIFRFQDDIKLWLSFFKFCEETDYKHSVSQMLVRMLQIHTSKPELWAFAAKWEFDQFRAIENARQILTRGLRFHPSSEIIYKELFKLELEHIKIKRKLKKKKIKQKEWVPDEVVDNILDGKLIEVIYSSAVKNIPGVEFKVCLLNEAKGYMGCEKIQNQIFMNIMADHSDDELAWDTMAKREFEGFSCDFIDSGVEPMEVDEQKKDVKRSLKEKILRSVAVYERAVKKLNTPKMWSFYLDHVLKINKNTKQIPILKLKVLRVAMEDAMASGNMEEKYYVEWAEVLRKRGKNKKLAEVLKKGTEQHPTSVSLWHARLRFYLSRKKEAEGKAVFKEAITNVPNALSVWKLMIQYLRVTDPSKLGELFEDGIKRGGEIAQSLKPLCLEWIVETKGIEEARSLFETTEYQHPPCLELYTTMAKLECAQPNFSLKHVRRCHELACTNFGQTDTNIWLDYIKFEMKHGDMTKINQIHRRAVKTLESNQVDEFVTEYNFIKTGATT